MKFWASDVQLKAMELAQAYFGTRFKTYRLTPMLQVQTQDLPVLGIYVLRERRQREQPEQSMPQFDAFLTLGLSGAVAAETAKQNELVALEQTMSELLDYVLLEDSHFVSAKNADGKALIGGIPSTDRVSQFAKVGETTLYEVRIEMVLVTQSYHPPRVEDLFERLHVTTQFPDQAHVDSGTLQIEREYELEQTTE